MKLWKRNVSKIPLIQLSSESLLLIRSDTFLSLQDIHFYETNCYYFLTVAEYRAIIRLVMFLMKNEEDKLYVIFKYSMLDTPSTVFMCGKSNIIGLPHFFCLQLLMRHQEDQDM